MASPESVLTIVSPAPDRQLLTIEELRAVADISDSSLDAELEKLGLSVATRIASACRVRRGGAIPPTLREETVLEIFRQRNNGTTVWPQRLRLARRPIVAIESLAYDGTQQSIADLVIDSSSGFIEWHGGGGFSGVAVAIRYAAGWDEVPDDLRAAAMRQAQTYLAQTEQQPGLRGLNIPGVIDRSYWVGQSSDPDMTQAELDMLGPYRNED